MKSFCKKGIILAGGSGSRLYPTTRGISKHLLPIYDKPMIYYPLSVLMLAGIRDILIITAPHRQQLFKDILGEGKDWGINLSYEIQQNHRGVAEALIIGEKFIGKNSVCLILGDNIFYGQGFGDILKETAKGVKGATVFGHRVADPRRFGTMEVDKEERVIGIKEKPINPKSNIAVTGLYFYDERAVDIAKKIKPSQRGELEITSVNNEYLKNKQLNLKILGRGYTWFDAGTSKAMMEASQFVEIMEKRQGYKIACLEEVAWRKGWIKDQDLLQRGEQFKRNSYGQYLKKLLKH